MEERKEISIETAMVLYQQATLVAKTKTTTLFYVDVFGEDVLVKVDLKDNTANVRKKGNSFLDGVITGDKPLKHFKLFTKNEPRKENSIDNLTYIPHNETIEEDVTAKPSEWDMAEDIHKPIS